MIKNRAEGKKKVMKMKRSGVNVCEKGRENVLSCRVCAGMCSHTGANAEQAGSV